MSSVAAASPEPADVQSREELGEALTGLRLRSGLSVRDVARRTGLPLATVGGYLTGRHLPPLATLEQFTGLLAVLGVPADQVPAWVDVVTRLRRSPGRRPADAVAPYVGLRAYQADDAALFFGREALTDQLAALLTSRPSTPVMVIGSSGSGKSSLLRAGVQARLVAAGVSVTVVTPGADPHTLLDTEDPTTAGGVLVVDQLEELFTSAATPEEVRAVVTGLARAHADGTVVVLALRADFFDRALEDPDLGEWLTVNQVLVGPLSTDDLRRVVIEPARVAGAEVDDGLVELLITDATAGSSSRTGMDAGALPLASHALYQTWLAASGRRLTLEGYRQVGRLPGAIAQTAETVHHELVPDAAAVERATLLRLVHVGTGTTDTRRVADLREFATPAHAAVITAYVNARLLTSDRGHVQIAHEALLTAWPRMREWLDADREGLRTHSRLTDAARRWRDLDDDPDLLYRGAALETLNRWMADAPTPPDLSPTEQAFVSQSRTAENARVNADRRSTRRLRALAAGMTVLAVSTGTLAALTARQASASANETSLAVSRQLAVQSEALAATDPALAGQLAVAADARADTVEARSALLSASGRDPVTRADALDAVIPALAVSPDGSTLALGTGDGRVVLETTGAHPRRLASVSTTDTSVYAVRFSPDGSRLAAAGDSGVLHLWDVRTPTAPAAVAVNAAKVDGTFYDVTFAPDGTTVFTAGSDDAVHVFARAADGSWAAAHTLPTAGTDQAVVVNPAGTLLAAAGGNAAVTLWTVDGATITPVGTPFAVAKTKVASLAFSPDGRTLAAGSTDNGVHLWDVHDPRTPTAGLTLAGPQSWINHVTFSPDGRTIAAASSDQHLWAWDATTGIRLDSFAHPTVLLAAAWAPDGSAVYSAGADGIVRSWAYPGATLQGFSSTPGQGLFGEHVIMTATVDGMRLWDATPGHQHDLLSVTPPAGAARFNGSIGIDDPLHLAVAGDTTGHVHFWDITDPKHPVYKGAVAAHTDWVEAIAFDSTGKRMVVCSDDASVTTWDLSGALPSAPTGQVKDLGGPVNSVSFAPDDTTVVAPALSGAVHLIDTTDLRHPTLIGQPMTGPKGYVYSAAFSPDGHTIAAYGNDKTIWLWDVTDHSHPRALGTPLLWADGYATNVLFSPNGRYLVAGETDGTVRVWDVTAPATPQRYASLTGISGTVYALAFPADSSQVSAAGSDRTVRIWDLTSARARAAVCTPAAAGLTMTAAEWGRLAGPLPQPPMCTEAQPTR